MIEDFERANKIQNGYFYTFQYNPIEFKMGYDRVPLIYCISPAENEINNFIALNFHQLPLKERINVLLGMNRISNFHEEDIRRCISKEELLLKFPGIKNSIRYYSRKCILNVYRVKSTAIHKYIDIEGNLIMAKPSTMMDKYFNEKTSNSTTNSLKDG